MVRSCTYPYKTGREPPLAFCDAAPPPFSVGGIHHFDDIPSFEAQLLVIHGNMVPQGFSTHHTAITDELEREPRPVGQRGKAVLPCPCPAALGRARELLYRETKSPSRLATLLGSGLCLGHAYIAQAQ